MLVCGAWLWHFLVILTYFLFLSTCSLYWAKFTPVSTIILSCLLKIVSEYDQEIPRSQTADKPVTSWGRTTQQSGDTRETNKAKQPPLSESNNQQRINKNRTTSLEPTAAKATGGSLYAFYWYQLLTLDSAVVEVCFSGQFKCQNLRW